MTLQRQTCQRLFLRALTPRPRQRYHGRLLSLWRASQGEKLAQRKNLILRLCHRRQSRRSKRHRMLVTRILARFELRQCQNEKKYPLTSIFRHGPQSIRALAASRCQRQSQMMQRRSYRSQRRRKLANAAAQRAQAGMARVPCFMATAGIHLRYGTVCPKNA